MFNNITFFENFLQFKQSSIILDFGLDFLINLIAITTFSYLIFYKRYKDKESLKAYMLFNIFIFTVIKLLIYASDGLDLNFGFGLFAILSLVTLRSINLTKIEITYFFGSLSIALINGIGITNYLFVILVNALMVLAIYFVDNPKILAEVRTVRITLDHIPTQMMKDKNYVILNLNKQFSIDTIDYKINKIDYVKDIVDLDVIYRNKVN